MAAKVGDIVRFLNSVGGGRITKIKDNLAYVEDEDGFETPVLIKECVVVNPSPISNTSATKSSKLEQPAVTFEQPKNDVIETKEGDKINIVLGYEPQEIKHLNTTNYDAYLINDSNYYLYFSYMTRADQEEGWTTRYADIVEPNIQIHLGEISRTDLSGMDRVAIQYIALKKDKQFALKTPALVEYRLDTTKFFKLHCFRENQYFEKPVIALDIVRNDVPVRLSAIDSSSLEDAIRAKKIDVVPTRKPVSKKAFKPGEIEVDLHISELVDTTRGLSNADMLNLQIDKFREVMDANLNNHGMKIIFIHGKGEGVLRQALMKELNYRYKGHRVQDASFREYGYGATQVTIK